MIKNKKDSVVLGINLIDTGIGIPSDRINDIFEPFTRLHSTENTYSGLSKTLYGNGYTKSRFLIFIFRSIVLFYMIELCNKFIQSSGITFYISSDQAFHLFSIILVLVVLFIPDPNVIISGLKRNTISFIIMGLATSFMALTNFGNNFDKIHLFNHSNKLFDSFPLTFICFADSRIFASPGWPNNQCKSSTFIVLRSVFVAAFANSVSTDSFGLILMVIEFPSPA